jgi:hypothetical protein
MPPPVFSLGNSQLTVRSAERRSRSVQSRKKIRQRWDPTGSPAGTEKPFINSSIAAGMVGVTADPAGETRRIKAQPGISDGPEGKDM